MPSPSVLSLAALGTGTALLAQAPEPGSPLQAVRRAELAFAKEADERGIRAAFLAWLAEEAWVFTPRMTRGWEHYGKEPGNPGHLAWYPEAMGIAAQGDLAWSHGPWSYASAKGAPARAHGHFLSIWRRQPGGGWKVVADIGVPHPAPSGSISLFVGPEGPAVPRVPLADPVQALARKEADLAVTWAVKGGPALLPDLAKGARLLRPGQLPLQDPAAIRHVLEAESPGVPWTPGRIEVSSGGDLAWTCGEARPAAGRGFSFLRIWTLEAGAWKVLYDVRVPHAGAT